MKILSRDAKRGIIRLLVEDNEDLWTLKKIISKDDIVNAKTTRVIKKEEGQEGRRRSVYIKLKVEKVEFMEASFTLKILGRIVEGPEDVPLNGYHSFNINQGDELTIEKEWGAYEKKELEKSIGKTMKILLTIIDNDEATHALLTNKIKELSTHEARLPRKDMPDHAQKKKKYFAEVAGEIKDYVKAYSADRIIIAGPGFASEELMKNLEPETKRISTQAHTNQTGITGIHELISNNIISKVAKDSEVSSETMLIEEFFKRVGKERQVSYGLENVKESVMSGAAETLIISEGLVIKMRENNRFSELEDIIKNAERMKTRVEFVGMGHDAGKRFERFTGIGAILRY